MSLVILIVVVWLAFAAGVLLAALMAVSSSTGDDQ
jgi:hypothetical protein